MLGAGQLPCETPCPLPNANPSTSFWHSEPELLGHRNTSTLPSEADVVVVGTGITGASALRYLVESGKKLNILALEAREVCCGATGRVCFSCDACSLRLCPSIHNRHILRGLLLGPLPTTSSTNPAIRTGDIYSLIRMRRAQLLGRWKWSATSTFNRTSNTMTCLANTARSQRSERTGLKKVSTE